MLFITFSYFQQCVFYRCVSFVTLFSFNTIEFFSTTLLLEENARAKLQHVFDFLERKSKMELN